MNTMHELKLDVARVDCLSQVLAFVDAHLEEYGCPIRTQMQIDVAVEEIYVNIASYAYAPDTGPAVIRAEVDADERAIEITFIDCGVPYDPLAKPDPDVTAKLDERQIGGLGIYMVKKSMDDMRYAYIDGQNVLTLRKKI